MVENGMMDSLRVDSFTVEPFRVEFLTVVLGLMDSGKITLSGKWEILMEILPTYNLLFIMK